MQGLQGEGRGKRTTVTRRYKPLWRKEPGRFISNNDVCISVGNTIIIIVFPVFPVSQFVGVRW